MRFLPTGSFARDSLKLMTGEAISLVVVLASTPILTRLYSPATFGAFGVLLALATTVSLLACLRYDVAIVLPERDEDALRIVVFSVAVALALSVAVQTLILVVPRSLLARTLGVGSVLAWIWLIPVSVVLRGLYLALSGWFTRTRSFGVQAQSRALESGVTGVVQTTAGAVFGAGVGGLAGGYILGQIASSANMALGFLRREWRRTRDACSIPDIWRQANRYRDFPIFSAAASLVNTVSLQMPALVLANYFGASVVGYYVVAQRCLGIPTRVAGASLARVYLQRAAEARRSGELSTVSLRLLQRLLALGLAPFAVLAVVAPGVFSFVLGATWRTAGIYVQWLSLFAFLFFVASPITVLFQVLEKQRPGLAYSALLLGARVVALMTGGLARSPELAVALYGVAGALFNLSVCIWLLKQAGVAIGHVAKLLLTELVWTLPFTSAALAMRLLSIEGIPLLIVVSATLTTYFALRFAIPRLPIRAGRSP